MNLKRYAVTTLLALVLAMVWSYPKSEDISIQISTRECPAVGLVFTTLVKQMQDRVSLDANILYVKNQETLSKNAKLILIDLLYDLQEIPKEVIDEADPDLAGLMLIADCRAGDGKTVIQNRTDA